jgi:hypothetical protein
MVVALNTYANATPNTINLNFSGQITTPYLTTHSSTFVSLSSGNTITLSPNSPTPQERRLVFIWVKLYTQKTNNSKRK